ncbi:MAG: permease [Gammaproteobacteria bacterium]|nr:MAG: permease [Gammaproteobacteria bacterium]
MLTWTGHAPWSALGTLDWVLLCLFFIWSGFVRSGLGFGGAALTLPFLLLVVGDPLVFLPPICFHLLFFSLLTVATRLDFVNWRYLGRLISLIVLPVAAGLIGLLNLPGVFMSAFVYAITLLYGSMYLLGREFVSGGRIMDGVCLLGGGYAAGASLIGAPLMVAYSAPRLPSEQLRDTLFVLWIVMVLAKLATFVSAGVNLQLPFMLAMFPLVALGHVAGLRLHRAIVRGGAARFRRVIGGGLVLVSLFGLFALL